MTYYRICYQIYQLSSDNDAHQVFENHLKRSWFNKLEKWDNDRWNILAVGIPFLFFD